MDQHHQSAILFFSRRATAEAREKSWTGRFGQDRQVARKLIRAGKQALRSTGWPVFHFHEGQQHGKSFGERLANAFETVFALGFSHVVAVGNDTPGLAEVNWKVVASTLKEGRSVIGRTVRGGTYLLGIPANQWDRNFFLSLPWQTTCLAEQYLTSRPQAFVLRECVELNDAIDLNCWLTHIRRDHGLAFSIRQILEHHPVQRDRKIRYCTTSFSTPLHRGPPVAV